MSTGVLLLTNGCSDNFFKGPEVVSVVSGVLCLGLGAGIFTPYLSAAAALAGICFLISGLMEPSVVAIVTLVLCVATAILGAGAYSVDGLLFGRRRVIL